jgi:hypothetical protein
MIEDWELMRDLSALETEKDRATGASSKKGIVERKKDAR